MRYLLFLGMTRVTVRLSIRSYIMFADIEYDAPTTVLNKS